MNRLHYVRVRPKGKRCSICQRPRREYVQVYYRVPEGGSYLFCFQCVNALHRATIFGETILTAPKDFKFVKPQRQHV